MDTDHDKREAELLARLEAEREQRLAEKIAAGEIVSVPLCVVGGSDAEVGAKVEQAKADALAELRAAGDQREVKFTVELVVTGVCRPGETADRVSVPTAPTFALREDIGPPLPPRSLSTAEHPAVESRDEEREAPEPVIESYIAVQIGRCEDGDVGQIEEGWFSVADGQVTVTNSAGGHVGSAPLKGQDARVVAKRLLRDKQAPEEEFNRVLHYPSAGLA